jgi:hypothetical protein
MTNRIVIIIIGIGLLAFSFLESSAQQDNLTKQVQVVRPYEPSISDAFKLNLLPQVEDTVRVVPIFSYNLALRPVTIDFPINLISPARMIAEPLNRVNWGYVKAGFGNYTSPLGEVFFANTRSKKYSFGMSAKYRGSFGNINLNDEISVDGTFQRLGLSAFGKRIFKNSVLDGGVNYARYGYGFYGHDTTQAALPVPNVVEQQVQNKFDAGLNYYSTYSDSTNINHRTSVRFINFSDNFTTQQNSLAVNASFDKFFKIEKVGASIDFVNHLRADNQVQSGKTIVSFSPWVGLFGKQWRTQAGLSATLEFNELGTQSHFYPIAFISYDVIGNYVIPYFQFSGFLEDNNYAKILSENPWVTPGIDVWNTSHKFIMKGGVKGNLSPRVAYNISGSFSLVDSAYFYVNTVDAGGSFLGNKFDVVFDDIRHRNLVGELTIAPTRNIKLALQAEYNLYSMNELPSPWHKPDYIGRAKLSYNIQDKILINAGFYIEGKRDIRGLDGSPIEIDGIMDLNIGAEYRLTKRISAFLDINNITANRYHIWYLYPTQQFNMRGGVTFAF